MAQGQKSEIEDEDVSICLLFYCLVLVSDTLNIKRDNFYSRYKCEGNITLRSIERTWFVFDM